jgi:hypothetical protein
LTQFDNFPILVVQFGFRSLENAEVKMCNSPSSSAVGDSTSLTHPASALVRTLRPREQAVVEIYPSCSDTEEESISNTSDDRSSKQAVSFGLIQVREYNRVVGDNPAVSDGPPMSIGWEFVQKEAVSVYVYEKRKLSRRTSDLRLGNFTCKCILRQDCDFSWEEIRAAEKRVRKIQRQRRQTIQRGETTTAIEYAMESAKRKMHRIFSNKPRLEQSIANSAKGLILDSAW